MEIVNKVAQSGLIQFDLEEIKPSGARILFDLKPLLFQGLVLKEKDFREFLGQHNWSQYQNAHVAITCTTDAIIPTWAYMLISIYLKPFAKTITEGNLEDLEKQIWKEAIEQLNPEDFIDGKIVIKGCSKDAVPLAAYVELSAKLQPIAKSLFFGEPCSTVPLFKKK